MDLDPGSILLFKNDKEGNEKRPDLRGELVTPDGKKLEVAVWTRTSKKSGDKFLSGSVQEPRQEQTTTVSATKPDDDIPF
jgi:uncharacterized protein (DUF736 family)